MTVAGQFGSGCFGFWGCVLWQNYPLVGGITLDSVAPQWPSSDGGRNWVGAGAAPPAISTGDANTSGALLTADAVANPGTTWSGDEFKFINHRSPRGDNIADYQNLLFADGHVAGRGNDIQVGSFASPASNWCLRLGATQYHWYWGASQ